MSTSTSMLPELRIALANFGPGGIVPGSAERWESAMRWDKTVSVLREWQPHIVLCQEISATAPAGGRGHLWTTANTLGMIPLPGSPGPGGATIGCTAILVALSAGLVILDAGPDWPPRAGAQPAWCEALVQIPGWLHPLHACSVDLSCRSSVEQRSQADHLASRVARLGDLGVAGGNWSSYGRADPVTPAALDSVPLHVRPSRMRYSPREQALIPNYDVHDVLACAGLVDAVAVQGLARSGPGEPASAVTGIGRVDRIYLTRDLAGAAARYTQQDMPDGEHQVLMITLDGAVAASITPPGRGR